MTKSARGSFSRLSLIIVALSVILVSATTAISQQPQGVPWDWSHRHLVFSHPGTADQASQKGNYEHWLQINNSPRYILQQQKRSANASSQTLHNSFANESSIDTGSANFKHEQFTPARQPSDNSSNPTDINPDISQEMNLDQRWAAQVGGNRQLPFGLTRAVIPPDQRFRKLRNPIHNGPPNSFQSQNLIKKDWSEMLGSGGTTGLGQTPATFTTGSNSCTDFVVFNTGLAGSSTQPNIIAFNNVYASCNGGVPTVYWAYNTSGTVLTSVSLSLDGTQVAFIQSSAGNVASLVLLKWKASTGTLAAPVTPTAATNALYSACTIPCSTSIPFSGNNNDTRSSSFVAYGTSKLYVGDDSGLLHQFTNIFAASGTPAEVTTGGWPATVNSSAALASPVYDSASTRIFVGDYIVSSASPCQPSSTTTNSPCGYLYSVNASGTVTRSAQLDFNTGILDGPIVDSTTGEVLVFAGNDGSTNCTASTPCAAVYQFPVGFASATPGTKASVGPGFEFMLSGTFDNAYFTSPAGTGHLYVVGNTGPANNTLYQISINSGIMSSGAATAGPVVSTNFTNSLYAAGLQVTEFDTGVNDYIFLSVLAYGGASGCGVATLANGCVIGYNVTSGAISSGTTPTGATAEAGGTSGIVVDNSSAGAQNIYFSTLLNQTCTTSGGTGGCAIQTIQSAP